MSINQGSKPLEIKISTVPAVSVILHTSDPDALKAAMQKVTGDIADYFDNDLAIIDAGDPILNGSTIDWLSLIKLFKSFRLNPVAARNASVAMEPAILASGLSIDALMTPVREIAEDTPETSKIEVPPPATEPAKHETNAVATSQQPQSMIVDSPVRAGQRIYARNADLIVTAIINNGAEIIADGSIHVYGPLRGRALAGATGDTAARIFTSSMEAELVSIAGIYDTFESGIPASVRGRPCQIRLNGNRIDLIPIN